MIFIFYILAAILIFFSYRSFRGGIDYLNYFKSALAKPRSNFTPFATIIAPCKGLDDGLEENLVAFLEQDYPDYEVIFVVDDEADAALAVIKDISRKDAKDAKKKANLRVTPSITHVIATKSAESSQKVENLREAVLHVSGESRVFVFVDSDARPSVGWLRNLVAPLEDENIGAATGYRWFISKKPTFASEMRSVWNASIASALGKNTNSNFCWGGSTAIRRDVFERLDIREKWRGALSDDFAVTRAMNEAGMPIYFVPQALTPSVENCTLNELFEFTTRQMKITRVYASRLWKLSFFGSGVFNVALIWAAFILAMTAPKYVSFWIALVTISLVAFFSTGKSWLRFNAVKIVLPTYDREISKQFWPQITLWLFSPALFLYNCFAALVSRRLTWRGNRYELISPNETRRIS